MKKFVLPFLLVVFSFSCSFSQSFKTDTTTKPATLYYTVEDGKGELVDVKVLLPKDSLPFDNNALKKILDKIISEGKAVCKNEVSFKPYKKSYFSIGFSPKTNEWVTSFNFLAANAYGAESEIRVMCNFDKDLQFVKSFSL